MLTDVQIKELDPRLRAKVKKLENGCWEWTGSKIHGYGYFSVSRKTTRAHRVAYQVWKGPIPEGMLVMHTCDYPPCINPEHLRVGTWADNVHDMHAKGRGHKGYWTRELILKAIVDWREATGKTPSASDWERAGSSPVPHPCTTFVRKVFGKWSDATGEALGPSISGYGWTNDGCYPFWPGISCIHCGKFVGRDGVFNYETWEMSNEISSLDAEHSRCRA